MRGPWAAVVVVARGLVVDGAEDPSGPDAVLVEPDPALVVVVELDAAWRREDPPQAAVSAAVSAATASRDHALLCMPAS
ncbi:MAG: hypothetical protein ACYDAD_11450 [Acidimicrobiales bacterium]